MIITTAILVDGVQKLLAQGKNEDIQRISVDKEYRKHLYEEYGLNELNAI
jgi:hypothetical protein